MEKSADAFRTISEVAEDLGLPQHVLRFWESRFPQIRPLKRAGGRRYYRPTDVELLRAIRQLLYEDGYTIKGVQRLLKERGVKALFSGGRQEARDDVLPEDIGFADRPAVRWEPERDADLGRSSDDAGGLDLERRTAISAALAVVEECERILKAAQAPSV